VVYLFQQIMRCPYALTALLAMGASSACSASSAPPATGVAAFVGVWAPVGQDGGGSVSSETCGSANPVVSPLTSNLTVTADGAALVSASTADGCMVILTVTANQASALEDQMCTIYAATGGDVGVETVVSYVLTVDGNVLTSAATGTTVVAKPKAGDAGVTDTNCSISSVGMYLKQ
jgi:hypothetical protein